MQQELQQLKDALESRDFIVSYLPARGYNEEQLLVDIGETCYSFHYTEAWTEEFVRQKRQYDQMYPEAPEGLEPPKSYFVYEDDELILHRTTQVEDVITFFVAYFESASVNHDREISGYSHACGYHD